MVAIHFISDCVFSHFYEPNLDYPDHRLSELKKLVIFHEFCYILQDGGNVILYFNHLYFTCFLHTNSSANANSTEMYQCYGVF